VSETPNPTRRGAASPGTASRPGEAPREAPRPGAAEPTAKLSLIVPGRLAEALDRAAHAEGTTVSALARRLLEQGLGSGPPPEGRALITLAPPAAVLRALAQAAGHLGVGPEAVALLLLARHLPALLREATQAARELADLAACEPPPAALSPPRANH
jgi:hypothetical protein